MLDRLKRHAGLLFTITLIVSDTLCISLAFYLAYYLRVAIPWPTAPEHIGLFRDYLGMLAIQVLSLWAVFFFYGLYRDQRARSWVDPSEAWTSTTRARGLPKERIPASASFFNGDRSLPGSPSPRARARQPGPSERRAGPRSPRQAACPGR